jgi:hypothetical protein
MTHFNWQTTIHQTSQSRNFTPFGVNQGQLTSTQAAQLRATGFQGLKALDGKHEEMRRQTVDRGMDELCGMMSGCGIGGKKKT